MVPEVSTAIALSKLSSTQYGCPLNDCDCLLNRLQVLLASPGSLSNSSTYIISLKFWRVTLSSDCDLYVTICDSYLCSGFLISEQGGVYASHFQASSAICTDDSQQFGWGAQEVWDFRFELSPSHTLTTAWSGTANKGHYNVYDAMSRSSGLWLTVCRQEPDERVEIRFIEVSIKTTMD